jgi:hypothetical protein
MNKVEKVLEVAGLMLALISTSIALAKSLRS